MKHSPCLISFLVCCCLNLTAQNSIDLTSFSYHYLDSFETIYYQEKNYERTLHYSLAKANKAKEEFGAVDSFSNIQVKNLALVYQALGQFEDSEDLLIQVQKNSLKLFGETSSQYVVALNDLATVLDYLGKFEQSELLHLQVLDIEKTRFGENHISYIFHLNSLAFSYFSAAKYSKALPFFKKVVELCEVLIGKNHEYYPTALVNLATSHKNIKEYEVAEKLFLEALSIEKKILGKNAPSFAISLNNVASLYSDMKAFSKAEKYYLEAIAILEVNQMQDNINYLNFHNNIAELYIDIEQFDLAQQYIQKCFILNAIQKDSITVNFVEYPEAVLKYDFSRPRNLINSLSFVTQFFEKKYESKAETKFLKNAFQAIQAAIKVGEEVKNSFVDKEDKLAIWRQLESLVEDGLKIGEQLAAGENEKYLNLAFEFAEENKSTLLVDALKGNRAHILGDLPDSLVFQEMDLLQQKDQLKKNKTETASQDLLDEIVKEENALNVKINLFLKSIQSQYPKYHALKYENVKVSVDEIQRKLEEKSILIEYFVSDEKTFVFGITKNEVFLHTIDINIETLEAKTRNLRRSLSHYEQMVHYPVRNYQDFTRDAHWFYNKLLEPILRDLSVDNLIIIPDKFIGYLLFETFLTKAAPKLDIDGEEQDATVKIDYRDLDFLLNKYNVSYNYSATLWKQNLEHNNQQTAANNGEILAMAPTYPATVEDAEGVEDIVRGSKSSSPYLLNQRKTLVSLPSAIREVKMLEHHFSGAFKFGEDCSEVFFKENADKYSVIHLAMHGIVHPRLPMLSSLGFTETQDSIEDDFLQAFEISHLKLNANLVVLSACETGYGKVKSGEGVISIARSFMYAGVSSLVVSLWPVNDYSTSILMQYFYENIKAGNSKSQSLRLAKLNYLKEAPVLMTHPSLWGGFIQIGNDTPIYIKNKMTHKMQLIGFGVIVLLLLLSAWGLVKKNKLKA